MYTYRAYHHRPIFGRVFVTFKFRGLIFIPLPGFTAVVCESRSPLTIVFPLLLICLNFSKSCCGRLCYNVRGHCRYCLELESEHPVTYQRKCCTTVHFLLSVIWQAKVFDLQSTSGILLFVVPEENLEGF